MKIEQKIIENKAIIELDGNLIGEESGATLMEKISEIMDNGCKHFAIDLSKVKYMNSSGIGVLISLLTRIRNKEGELVLINPSEHIQKLLLITKLNKIFLIFDSQEEALERLVNG